MSIECPLCQKSFPSNQGFLHHASLFHKSDKNDKKDPPAANFQCQICSQPFEHLFRLRIHERSKHPPLKDLACEECGKVLGSSSPHGQQFRS